MRTRWPMLGSFLVLACVTLAGVALSPADRIDPSRPPVLNSERAGGADQMFSGTIKGIDQVGMRMVIETKKGMLYIQAADADAIRGLAMGDQVTVKMDEQGYVLEITKKTSSKLIV